MSNFIDATGSSFMEMMNFERHAYGVVLVCGVDGEWKQTKGKFLSFVQMSNVIDMVTIVLAKILASRKLKEP